MRPIDHFAFFGFLLFGMGAGCISIGAFLQFGDMIHLFIGGLAVLSSITLALAFLG